jgi:hypothetical protein
LYVLGIIQHEQVFCDIPNLGSVPNFLCGVPLEEHKV